MGQVKWAVLVGLTEQLKRLKVNDEKRFRVSERMEVDGPLKHLGVKVNGLEGQNWTVF